MNGAVAAGHELVTAAAGELLAAGGNAFDAAVAAGFASAVVEPGLTSLGGGGFLLARSADGRARVFDFFVDTPGRGEPETALEPHFVPLTVRFPASEQTFNVGLGSVAVPGTLRGLLTVHRALGRAPLVDVLAPAIAIAKAGVPIEGFPAYVLDLLRPVLTLTAAGRAIYEPGGRRLGEGDVLVNADLGSFLDALPEGADRDFYEGSIAERIAEDMRGGGGLLTAADLAAYEVIEREPLAVSYRGGRVLTNPPPSFGGSMLALSLALLEAADLSIIERGSADHLELLARAMQEVGRFRDNGFRSFADLDGPALEAGRARVVTSSGGTTHVSVCDSGGNAASMTTSNGECSGYVARGTGIMLNNMLGEDDLHPEGFHAAPPGLRVSSMMAPTIVLGDDGVRLVVGSGGSKRIRTALLQVISNVVDFGLSLDDAVAAPRVHWDGALLQCEPGFAPGALERVGKYCAVNPWKVCDVYFGGAHAVSPEGQAAGDARRGGAAAVMRS